MSVVSCCHMFERVPQQIAQACEHAVGRPHVSVHQRRDGVQGVEEEVRVELALEDLELGLREPRFELGGLELPLDLR